MNAGGFLGQVRLARPWKPARGVYAARPKLAQAPESPVADMARVVSQPEWAAQAWTKESAVITFNIANLIRSIHDKVAYSAITFRDIVADPRFTGVLGETEDGREFISAATKTWELSEQLAQPNLLASITNLQAALEVNVLPSFGIGVVGVRPLYRNGRLDAVAVNTTTPARSETIDFGNLLNTPLKSDAEALATSVRKIESVESATSLGALTFLNFLIGAAVLIGGALLLVGEISDAVRPVYADPKIHALINKMGEVDPERAKELWARIINSRPWWEAASDVAQWVAVGVGTIAVAWLLVKLSGMFEGEGAGAGRAAVQ